MNIENKGIPTIKKHYNIILFDGVCKLCNAWGRFVIKYDKNNIFKLASMQSDEGQIILKHFNLPTENFMSILYIEDKTIYDKSTAFLKIVSHFSFPIKFLFIFKYIPLCLRDYIYDYIARNRYTFFGKYEQCILPTADSNERYIKMIDIENYK